VAEALGINLLVYARREAFRRNLPRAIYHSDTLTHPNSVAFLLVSSSPKHGVTTLLSGEGADELLRHPTLPALSPILLAKRLLAYLPVKVRKAIALVGYACHSAPIAGFREYEGGLAYATAFIDKFARESLRVRCEDAYQFIVNDTERFVLGAMLADVTNYLTPLLRRLDRMSMAASVECRVPFLDHRLVEAVLNLPLSYRLRGSTDKWVLKEIASRYLPHHIVYRKKLGFPLPLKDYLAPLARQEFFLGGFCLEFLGMQRGGAMAIIANWRQNVHGFFNLLALEIWGLFFMGQPLEELIEQVTRLPNKTASSPNLLLRPDQPLNNLVLRPADRQTVHALSRFDVRKSWECMSVDIRNPISQK
jgi:asparagine synthase (glutamine-hydrolysing)